MGLWAISVAPEFKLAHYLGLTAYWVVPVRKICSGWEAMTR